jgi:hypothetical protein
MPCYETRTLSVEFHARHRKILEAALDSLGWQWAGRGPEIYIEGDSIVLDLDFGRARVLDGQQPRLNTLKRAYSKQALRKAARLQGWQVKGAEKGVIRR